MALNSRNRNFQIGMMSAFPRVLEIGVTNAEDINQSGRANYVYPYMIMNFIQGEGLSSLGEKAMKNENNAEYFKDSASLNLYTKKSRLPANEAVTLNHRRAQAVVYQLVQILYKLKRLKIFGQEYGFLHGDVNAGNVMVRKEKFTGDLNVGFGTISFSGMPLLALMDAGHATSNLDKTLGSKVESLQDIYFKSLRFRSGSLSTLYENLNDETLGAWSEAYSGLGIGDSDMRLFRLIARALYDSDNYKDKEIMKFLKDCSTRTDCVKGAPKIFLKRT